MLDNKRVIIYTFAGRKRYLEMLVHYSLKCRPFVDKHVFCVHTSNEDDIQYMRSVCEEHPDYFEMLEIGYKEGFHFHLFYKYFTDMNTYYVKLDDDVCWMDEGAIETLVRYKRDNPELIVAFANTINNGLCIHLHQRMGLFDSPVQTAYDGYFVIYTVEPERIRYVSDVHEGFLKSLRDGTTDRYKSFYQWILSEGAIRVSINCICMTGKDTGDWLVHILNAKDDEGIISEVLPIEMQRINAICGGALVSHFAFGTQREYLEKTDLLDQYRALIGLDPWRDK